MIEKEKKIQEMTDEDWKSRLSPEQYEVCRNKATEIPFSGKYYYSKDKGIYQCACCGNELFKSDTKFESGTGWPSFYAPINQGNIEYHSDNSYGMTRVEITCRICGAHLGQVFDDGPLPSNKRYCINSVSLDLVKKAMKICKNKKFKSLSFIISSNYYRRVFIVSLYNAIGSSPKACKPY